MNQPTGSIGVVDVGEFFDGRARTYDYTYDVQGWGGYVLRTRLRAVLDMVGDGPGDALDAGMGPGRLCSALRGRGWTISGIDVSEEMVRHARRRIPDASEQLRRGTIDRLPFDDASFDVAAATGVLEYVESVPDALGELSRVLRPGGRAVISVPNSRSFHAFSRRSTDPIARLAKRAFHRTSVQLARRDRIPPLDRLPRILNDAGLQVTEMRHVAALVIPAPLDRLMPATSQRLGLAAEDRTRLRRLAATQVVIGVRKGGAPDGVPSASADR